MRNILSISALVAGLAVAGAAFAAEDAEKKEQAAAPDWGVQHDACFGDRYETDADLNEGNTVSIDEILALIDPPRT